MSAAKANALTATWASRSPGAVFSAAAVYPLLALLASVASGRARLELSAVAPQTMRLPVRSALGLWTREGVPLTLDWAARADPRLTGDPLIDRPLLDAWAAAQTGAPVPPLPFTAADPDTVVLAAALAVTADWVIPFTDGVLRPAAGPWAGRRLASLHRRDPDLTALRAVKSPSAVVTLLTVRGTADIDVVLCTAAGAAPPPDVLATAVETFATAPVARKGPGITSALVDAADPAPELVVKIPRFAAAATHDLLRSADVFGLRAAAETALFPGISDEPLRVATAAVSAAAAFTAPGFRATPVTRAPVVPVTLAPPPATARALRVTVRFDEPFGYLAVHRPTGLVLLAGWIDDPEPAR
ncbi:hypothetical protein [Dactylosporangium matsuzakiense]|uniref:Serine protease inhibitor n=1 Tax=Dactylosporangium matsuzakiense TaxID=53360 RepID=A0A9W6KKC2_9ACTN|nr:hypothetical protein [Dactylosporangium matsuzakiense]UWZ43317.1 hypothetical protein Dmats_38495 [Dactylosporangium matsuzakiense]GLL02572.1 hypothetical protein GCM10017581_043140 [Dactylosporangium matsuzakiense]